MKRELESRKGEVIETDLTDSQAAEIAGKSRSDVAKDIAAKYKRAMRLSPEQLFWLHKAALDILDQDASHAKREKSGELRRAKDLIGIFSRAAEVSDYPPKLTFMTDNGTVEYRYTISGSRPGILWITNGERYGSKNAAVFGSVQIDGRLSYMGVCPDWVRELTDRLIDDPAETTQEIAAETGTCPGCGMSAGDEMHDRCADRFGFGE